jgi:RecA/RadA recombinase
MPSLMERVLKNSTLKTQILSDSDIFKEPDYISTPVPVINIALSGKFEGGLTGGITSIAGPSKHFKSTLALIMAKSYLDKYDDAIIFFYDNERGMTADYFRSVGIDPDRVVYAKIHNIEELKHDLMTQLSENIQNGDKCFIMVDSVGNLASKKEVDDAIDGKTVADMTRAKAFKSLYRMITPYITDFDIPYVQIAHVYSEIGLFPKIVVSGGTGIMLASDTIIVIGRAQEKEGKELTGYTFKLKIEKSRFAVEGSILELEVSFEGGVKKYGGLLEMALKSGHVIKPKNGWYTRPCVDGDKSWRKKDTYSGDFWQPVLEEGSFIEWVNKKYSLTIENLVEDSLIEDIEDIEED